MAGLESFSLLPNKNFMTGGTRPPIASSSSSSFLSASTVLSFSTANFITRAPQKCVAKARARSVAATRIVANHFFTACLEIDVRGPGEGHRASIAVNGCGGRGLLHAWLPSLRDSVPTFVGLSWTYVRGY